jgi:two-component system, NarL family, nitrate/nitrite response regulator NarL
MTVAQSSVTVVLADDHPIVLNGLKGLLSSDPRFDVAATFSNGKDALQGLRQLEPTLAVLDICMPGLTGVEVLKSVEDDGLGTRVVFLTATATDEQIVEAVSHGAWGIMLKDAAADALVDCLSSVVDGERWLPPELVSAALAREASRRENSEQLKHLLTTREREIAMLVADGLSNKEIARRSSISEGTVKIHLHNAYQKLGVANRTSLAGLARRNWGQSGT